LKTLTFRKSADFTVCYLYSVSYIIENDTTHTVLAFVIVIVIICKTSRQERSETARPQDLPTARQERSETTRPQDRTTARQEQSETAQPF